MLLDDYAFMMFVTCYLMSTPLWCLLHVTWWPCLFDVCDMLLDDHNFLMFVTCYLMTMPFWCFLHVTSWPCFSHFWCFLHVTWWPCLSDVCYMLLDDHAFSDICNMLFDDHVFLMFDTQYLMIVLKKVDTSFASFVVWKLRESLHHLCLVELSVLSCYCYKLRTFRHIRRKSLAAGSKSLLYSFSFLSKNIFLCLCDCFSWFWCFLILHLERRTKGKYTLINSCFAFCSLLWKL